MKKLLIATSLTALLSACAAEQAAVQPENVEPSKEEKIKAIKSYSIQNDLYSSRVGYELRETSGRFSGKLVNEMFDLIKVYNDESFETTFSQKMFSQNGINLFLRRDLLEDGDRANWVFYGDYTLEVEKDSQFFNELPMNIIIGRHGELVPKIQCEDNKTASLIKGELIKVGSTEAGGEVVDEQNGYRIILNDKDHKMLLSPLCLAAEDN